MLQSKLLADSEFRHAFFTKEAPEAHLSGATSQSPPPYLDFATHTGSDQEHVEHSFEIAARFLGVSPEHVLCINQIHGTETHFVACPLTRRDTMKLDGDALIGHDNSIACGVRVADCVPILIGDRKTGVAAAVHSGWRGSERNIVARVIEKLARMGSDPSDIIAAVGPHIEICCFEMESRLARQAFGTNAIVPSAKNSEIVHVDLRSILHRQLIESGVSPTHIDHLRGCSKCDPKHFYSYRRDGLQSGRHLAAIVPKHHVSNATL